MNYSANLPRTIKIKSRCLALSEDGAICKRTAKYEITIHPDPEINFERKLKWARIFVCEEHIPSHEKSQIK